MARPIDASSTGGRLRGSDISNYMDEFHNRFFVKEGKSIVRFNAEVTRIQRGPGSKGWSLTIKDTRNPEKADILRFPRIVLCTGVSAADPPPSRLI
jgi:cation diffusion facilitator CzcD-associated flavoprotein CzcO